MKELTPVNNRNFYIYGWYRKTTEGNELFYIGKGKKERYLVTKQRNRYFTSIINTYETFSEILINSLTEQESWELEELIIDEAKSMGLCKANFMRGGRGGNTRQFMSEDDKKELVTRQIKTFKQNYKKENHPFYGKTGKQASNYGNTHTEKSNKQRSASLSGRKLTEEHRLNLRLSKKGKTLTEEHKKKIARFGRDNGNSQAFSVTINNKLYRVYSKKELLSLIKDNRITTRKSKKQFIKSIETLNKIIMMQKYTDLLGNVVIFEAKN